MIRMQKVSFLTVYILKMMYHDHQGNRAILYIPTSKLKRYKISIVRWYIDRLICLCMIILFANKYDEPIFLKKEYDSLSFGYLERNGHVPYFVVMISRSIVGIKYF